MRVSSLSINTISSFGLSSSDREEQLRSELYGQIQTTRSGTAEDMRRAMEHMLRSVDEV